MRPALFLGQPLDDVLDCFPADQVGQAGRSLFVLLEVVVEVAQDGEGVLAGVRAKARGDDLPDGPGLAQALAVGLVASPDHRLEVVDKERQ